MNGGWVRAAGAGEIVRPRRLLERFWAALNFTVRRSLRAPKLSEEVKMPASLESVATLTPVSSVLLRTSSFIASGVRVQLSAALLEVGARAIADSMGRSGAWALRARAPSAFVPSAVARLPGHYVALPCARKAARAQ